MNKSIKDALNILEREYYKIKGSINQYKVREEILNRVEEMKNRSIEKQNIQNNTTKETVLNAFVKIIEDTGYSDTDYEITENMTVLNIKEKFNLDTWDWFDIMVEVSELFDVHLDDELYLDDVVLKDIIEEILKDI
ncbi:hypothetical protein ACQ27_gp009 [Klebsiella phage K64-1]|uniref:Uncharacterized protein n=1 Tax=Klebsiella phage vB_KleM_RaK2 TaxID=1147094 RepID=H6X3G6_9CAUD|nr:hypothetical protein F403_gp525 [Klebsiella phage vB_KleM_RaK2]YP_010842893.1 hypothetical protein ACQ27_gp009 [Klebsiella phage K64-1]AFA44282.1 hypothetical protein RaK2_00009 [Klebsiella phage vB_KleM_RaK2]